MSEIWTQASEQDQLKTLFSLGYFQGREWDEVRQFMLGDSLPQNAIEQYRDFHGIQGDEDPAEHMLRPRCGLPDFVRDPLEASQCKWPMLDVTTCPRISGLNPLSEEQERAAWLESIQAWNAVCGIRMALTDNYGAANIYADPGSTGPGVLAYSYLPCNVSQTDRLQQVYNRSTNWSYRLLVNVIIHEIGHAIGLDHGPRGSIMQPTAGGDILRPQAWDIEQVVLRYGLPNPSDPIPPPPVPGVAVEMKKAISKGFYYLEPVTSGEDAEIKKMIQPGKYRLLNEFEMG